MGQTQNDCRDRPGSMELTCLLVVLAIWPASSRITAGVRVVTTAQSAGQQVAIAERAGLLREDEEGGLEGVVRGVRVAQDAAADPQHHRPVPLQEDPERRLPPLPPGEEFRQQFMQRPSLWRTTPLSPPGGEDRFNVKKAGSAEPDTWVRLYRLES